MDVSKIKKGAKYDVIVVGGGVSGSAAAITAGREGARVLLVEQTYSVGGMWTGGFVTPLFDYENKTGLLKEVVGELKSKNAFGGFWDKSFNFEYMKFILEQMCIKAGVDILYDTKFVGAEKNSKKVEGIYVSNIEGITYYEGDIIIDASGDGCVAYDMGLCFNIGKNENPETCQAMTLMFLVGGIPEKYKDGLVIYDVVEKAFERQGEGRHLNFDMPYLIPIPDSDFALIQLTHMSGYSPLSALDRGRAAAEGREQVMEVFEALKYFDDDFKKLYLISTAPLLGIRESRRIKGEYTLTEEDILSGAQFDDGVCTVTFWVDIHPAKGEKQECADIKPYQIPFRSMLPLDTENVIIAGKNISGTHLAHASYRVTGNCFKMGEAAGKAACYSVKNNVPLRCVPAEIVKE